MKDAVATMGGLLPDDAGGRDAVHVAVFSAVSAEKLFPGQDVGTLSSAGGQDMRVATGGNYVGIVDPYLKMAIMPGERFWVYLYPRTITGLAHRWSHPAFDDDTAGQTYSRPDAKARSEEWLRTFCKNSDCPSYETVMAMAAKVADGRNPAFSDEYLHFDGSDAHGDIPAEFWEHVSVVLGRDIKGPKPTYFSCSC